MKLKLFFTIIILSFARLSTAQMSTGGTPPSFNNNNNMGQVPVFTTNSLNNDSLVQNEPVVYDSTGNNIDTTIMPKNYFAINQPVDFYMNSSGVWNDLADGRQIWRLVIQSPTAIGISLMLKEIYLIPGAALYFYDLNHQQISGAYTSTSNKEDSVFIAPFLEGNTICIEYVHPSGLIPRPNFLVKDLIHTYKTTDADNDCHNNVVCPEFNDYCNQIRSVVKIMTSHVYKWSNCNTTNYTTYWSQGSGALINNSLNDFTPYILTARHVIWDQLEYHWCIFNKYNTWGFVDMANIIFEFNYQSNICNPSSRPYQTYYLRGASVVESEAGKPAGADMALLRLHEEPPIQANVYYSGWNRQSKDDLPSWSVTGIHHPGGDLKKISKGNLHYSLAYGNYWGVDWYNGVTEQGSSGSPLFCDGDKRIIGALSFGANDDCDDHNEQDRYGRLRSFWGKVKDELSPDDHNRNTWNGVDPATFCRSEIEINGIIWPYALYNLNNPLVVIQASDHIKIAHKSTTEIGSSYGLYSNYNLYAGQSIIIEPSGTDVFKTAPGTELVLEIRNCQSKDGCGGMGGNPGKPTDLSTSIIESGNKHLNIYPNPSNGNFNVKLSESGSYDVKVTDLLGKVIYISKILNTNEFKIQLSGYPSGTYFIQINSKTAQFTGKVLIQ